MAALYRGIDLCSVVRNGPEWWGGVTAVSSAVPDGRSRQLADGDPGEVVIVSDAADPPPRPWPAQVPHRGDSLHSERSGDCAAGERGLDRPASCTSVGLI